MTRTVLGMEVEGVKPRGRSTSRYMESIRRHIKKNGLTDVNIRDRKVGKSSKHGRYIQDERIRLSSDAV